MTNGGQRRALVAVLCAVLLLLARRVGASDPARLVYVRGPGAEKCPDEDGVRDAVSTHLGHDPFVAVAPLTVLVEVTRSGGRFVARLSLVDKGGSLRGGRQIETRGDCTDLVRALALNVSLAIDPLDAPADESAPAAPSPPPPAVKVEERAPPAQAPPPPPVPEVAATKVDTVSADRTRAIQPFLGLGVLGSFGVAPAPSVGADLFAGIAWRRVSLELDVRTALPTGATVALGNVRSSMVLGAIVPCMHLGAPFVCAVAGLGSIHATGDGATSHAGDGRFGAAGVRAGIELALGDTLRLRGHLEALAILGPPTLTIGGVEAYAFSPIAADAGVGVIARFP